MGKGLVTHWAPLNQCKHLTLEGPVSATSYSQSSVLRGQAPLLEYRIKIQSMSSWI